tara:strand:+ start:525 stop:1973 length:1449 start_codon:yes stop_codon:yes gene_type:complete
MLEAKSHQTLKELQKTITPTWQHNLTLSRLVGRSLRRKDHTIIQIDLCSQNSWWLGLLIPLCIDSSDTMLVLNAEQRKYLFETELPKLNKNGYKLYTWEKEIPPPGKELWIANEFIFLNAYKNNFLLSKQIIVPDIERFNMNLCEALSIRIDAKDWTSLLKNNEINKDLILEFYNTMTKSLFRQSSGKDCIVKINSNEISSIRRICNSKNITSKKWNDFFSIDNSKWTNWAELKHANLSWRWLIKPVEPFQVLEKLFNNNPFIFIVQSDLKETLISKKLETISCEINSEVTLISHKDKKEIAVFAPKYQPLPNSKIYMKHLFYQAKRLIISMHGISILIIDDPTMLLQVTSLLASEFGTRVTLENINQKSNSVICCSSLWWLSNYQELSNPKQLIIGLLPFASLAEPLTAARVENLKRLKKDWFRELLLPEAMNIFAHLVFPLRNTDTRLAILDGRLRSRRWGNDFLDILEPWKAIHSLLPP